MSNPYGQGGYPPQQPYGGAGQGGGYPGSQPSAPPQQSPYGQPGGGGGYPGGPPQAQAPYPGAQPQGGGYPGQGGGYPPQAPYPGAQSGGGNTYGGGPPPGVSQEVWGWFRAVDQDGSGQISATELQPALTNGNWKPFSLSTCHAMVNMFDKDHSGTIDVSEFSSLWSYIENWKRTFEGYDRDRSGGISHAEMGQALQSFGYRLGPHTVTNIMLRYDKKRTGSIQFEDFIVACCKLQALTGEFKKRDTAQSGSASIRYEDFLTAMLSALLDGIGNR